MPADPFRFLTAEDRQLLLDGAQRITYQRGDVLFAEGNPQPNLFLIQRGTIRIERRYEGHGIAVARYGPGELLGEVAFLTRQQALGSAVAEEDAEVDVLDGARVQARLASESGFATRFYQSLAVLLGERLVQVTPGIRLPEAFKAAAGPRPRLPRTGQISERQVPPELAQAVAHFRSQLHAFAAGLDAGQINEEAARPQVVPLCDQIAALLNQVTGDDALYDIGMEDPTAFRDAPELARGVAGYVFRETFPFFMQSATIAQGFERPRGYPEDRDFLERIEQQPPQPEGDGRLGPLLDAWFLGRPLCRARRNSLRAVEEFLRLITADMTGPVPVTSLSAGTARELFASLAAGLPIQATCLDADLDVLAANAAAARRVPGGDRITFLQGDLASLIQGTAALALGPQQVIYGLGVCDYLTDEQIRGGGEYGPGLLRWAHDHLRPGGWLLLSNRNTDSPDRAFTEHILDWPVVHRTREEFEALFAGTGFALPEIEGEESGVLLLARCHKAG
jgi:extracellular factor (EF) 3-hydroxypalmitic acid methyl ester biosynthesis protein